MRNTIITTARSWIGTPYHHQASLKGVGCDCLGLLRGVWREVYGDEPEDMPAYSRDWAESLKCETLADAAGRHLIPIAIETITPGDVLLFSYRSDLPAKHCAILTGPETIIHAYDSHAVAEVAFAPWWRRRLKFAFAFPIKAD
jgi:NlpC/P60 family putative phage cell wall peptidase